jgi:hypothetical protein
MNSESELALGCFSSCIIGRVVRIAGKAPPEAVQKLFERADSLLRCSAPQFRERDFDGDTKEMMKGCRRRTPVVKARTAHTYFPGLVEITIDGELLVKPPAFDLKIRMQLMSS